MSAYLASLWGSSARADDPSQSSPSSSDATKEAAAVRELAARLEATDVEVQLRRGGEAGLAPPGHGLGTTTLRRWLVAEKWDVQAAFDRLVTHAQWRADYVPRGFIHEDEVAAELATGKCFIQGTGPGGNGRPLFVVLVSRHSKTHADAATLKRFVCWCLDTAAAAADPAIDGPTILGLFDFRGVTMDCLDIVALRQIFGMLQTHFPERMGRVVMYCAPRVFSAIWRVLQPFLDARTKEKIVFVGEGGAVAALPGVPRSILPHEYGGTADKIPIDVAAAAVRERSGKGAHVSRPPSGASAASAATAVGVGVGLGGVGAAVVPQDDDDDTMCEADEVAALEAAAAAEMVADVDDDEDGCILGGAAVLCT